MRVAALAGGVGGAKLLVGLARAVGGANLTAVVNTGDDARIYGVHVSPDVDICTYWLAGVADTERGWGIERDSFRFVEALGARGGDNWFRLGDGDLATCVYRSGRLGDGATLTDVTAEIAGSFGVESRLLPMSDDRVGTQLLTADGRWLEFQDYFVKERTAPEIERIRYQGIEDAKPAPGVLDALVESDVIVVCPSNPLLSVAPILDLPGVRDVLRAHPRAVAVSPIVRGAALKGPADRLLARLVGDSSASAVAKLYADFCDLFVCDLTDTREVERARAAGVEAIALDTVMTDHDASERLAAALLQAAVERGPESLTP